MADSKQLMSTRAVFLLGINSIVGSGIFLLSGKLYTAAGVWSLLAIVLAGLSMLVIGSSYANMSKIYPENGGACVYVKGTFGRFPGFIVGMLAWLQTTITISTETSAFLTALKMLYPKLQTLLIGLAIILILGVFSFFGGTILTKLNNLSSLLKIVIILAFVFVCVWLIKGSHFALPSAGSSQSGLTGFLSAYGTAFFFFTGFTFLPINAEKMKNPTKTLPKMILLVISVAMVIYTVIQAVGIGVLGAALPKTAVPAATAFADVVGTIGGPIIIIGLCISVLGVAISATFNAPTIFTELADQEVGMPAKFAKTNQHGTASVAVIVTTICAALLFTSGSYSFLAGMTVFLCFVQYISTALANIKKKYIWVGIGALLFSLVLFASFTVPTLLLGFSIIVLLALAYLIYGREKKRLEKK